MRLDHTAQDGTVGSSGTDSAATALIAGLSNPKKRTWCSRILAERSKALMGTQQAGRTAF